MERLYMSDPRGVRAVEWRRPLGRLFAALIVASVLLFALLRTGLAQSGTGDTPPAPPLAAPSAPTDASPISANTPITPPNVYVVKAGDSVFAISQAYSVTMDALAAVNQLADPDRLEIGQVLVIPEPDGSLPDGLLAGGIAASTPLTNAAVISRLTTSSLAAPITSPFYRTTWLSYYGRPGIPVMGIIGEFDVITLTTMLKDKAKVIDEINGPALRVKAAFHLVHGMATVASAFDGSHLEYLPDDVVMKYINAGLKNNIAVILDVQVGALSPSEAISRVLPYLQYPNVHLAIDPEFAVSHPGQTIPGNPIGFVTGAQVNAAQKLIFDYMAVNKIRGRRMLMVHQFFDEMIVDRETLDWDNERVDLILCADGFGDPWGKITKYNDFFTGNEDVTYTAFKLFYRWDEPVLTERQAMGVEKFSEGLTINVAPNMLIYQ